MKVTLLADSLGFGGAQRQIANLAVELKKHGHEVEFIRYRKDDFYRPILEKAGIEPKLVAHKYAPVRMMKLKKAIKQSSPDAVISFLTVPNFYACMAAIGKHKWKTIVSERCADEPSFRDKKQRILRAVQSKYADVIVCNSKCAENLWKVYFPKTIDKLQTIYNIIEVPNIVSDERNDGKCRLVVAARYETVKNLDGMLKAVSLLSEEERNKLEIHWYGKANVAGAADSVLRSGEIFIKQNGLEQCVFLHPATDQIYPIMAETDFVSLFSYMEGLPNAIIEGMTLKKPVVMTRISDYSVLVDENNGFLCNPDSADSIADALRKAINSNHEEREKMGQCSYEKIKKICSRDAVYAQWDAVIR